MVVFCKNAPKWGCLLGGDFERNRLKKRGGGGGGGGCWSYPGGAGGGILRHNRGKSPKYQRFFSKTTKVGFFLCVGGGGRWSCHKERAYLVNFYGILSCENFQNFFVAFFHAHSLLFSRMGF